MQSLITTTALSRGIYHVVLRRNKRQRESMLTRYGIVKTTLNEDTTDVALPQAEGGRVTFKAENYSLTVDLERTLADAFEETGFEMRVSLSPQERLFGLGDENRDSLMKRGRQSDLWQKNVTCYGPIPYVMSSQGWAILVNCTYSHHYDLGVTEKDIMSITCEKGMLDFYVFLGDNMVQALEMYTRVSGRPLMLPKPAYGLTFVCNEEEGARDLLENCLNFRREKIPCDIMGLEPGWMSKHYDFSTEKKWDEGRFYLPYWLPENYSGDWSFFYNLRQMGFLLSLWLCCDYDLLWEEEKAEMRRVKSDFSGAEIIDQHFSDAEYMDKFTKPGQPWFEHLKKFVDNGASAFKLDGAVQIVEHPDRLYAGRYTDDEVHNVYPVIYGKQMQQGFSNYTGRRALIYTCGLYAGQQQFCATWAGDTGGGPKTMVSIMNLAMCGHANASCDMDVSELAGIHYSSLMPWTQHLGWRNWQHPWFLGDELEGIYRDYAQLRSALFPYIYATAHQAAAFGLPIVRPLSLVWPNEPRYDNVLNEYMLGDSLLVGAFDSHIVLPEGRWTDFFTETHYVGGTEFDYDPPKGKGGALMVRDGGIVVMQDWMPHLTHHVPNQLYVHLYAGCDGQFVLCEDDGMTYGYKEGAVAKTVIAMENTTPDSFKLSIAARTGCFEGMPSCRALEIVVHNAERGAQAEGFDGAFDGEKGLFTFRIGAQMVEKGLRLMIKTR